MLPLCGLVAGGLAYSAYTASSSVLCEDDGLPSVQLPTIDLPVVPTAKISPVPSVKTSQPVKRKRTKVDLPSPPSFSNITAERGGAMYFSGMKCDINQTPCKDEGTKLLHIAHSITAGSVPEKLQGNYDLATTLQLGGAENASVLISRWTPSKSRVDGRLIFVRPSFTSHTSFQGQGPKMFNLETIYTHKGKDWKSEATFANQGKMFSLSYTQHVTENLALGALVRHVFAPPPFAGPLGYMLEFLAKYKMGHGDEVLAHYQTGELQLRYKRQVNKHLTCFSELVVLPGTLQSEGKIDLQWAGQVFISHAQFDTQGCVRAMLEHFIFGAVKISVSGEMDHVSDRSAFGVGVSFGNA